MVFTKEIRVQAKDLRGPLGAKEIFIVLGFNEDAIKTSNEDFATAVWKVAPFTINKPGHQSIDVTYVAKIGVCKAQVDSGKIVRAAIDTPIDVGQQIDLVNDSNPQFDNIAAYFNEEGFAINDKITNEVVTIGTGLYDDNDNFSPLIVWEDVWNGSSVDIQFTPNISIFATSQYKESQLFTGHINAALWKHNIADATLPAKLVFDLFWDVGQNRFVLLEAWARRSL